MMEFLLRPKAQTNPPRPVPASATDLRALPDGHFVWLGHSTFLFRLDGRTILIDPVFGAASPGGITAKPFPISVPYGIGDMPVPDLVLITHDHYDHLEYETILALADAPSTRFITPLGVGAHLEYWGIPTSRITELDWWDACLENLRITLTPSQHFSGRTLRRNPTLWGGFVLEASGKTIYISGDGGRGEHFSEIARRFPVLDWAMLEAGQYNPDWPFIHMMPDDWRDAARILNPKHLFASHHGRYALSTHPWNEPLQFAQASARTLKIPLTAPLIGAPVRF